MEAFHGFEDKFQYDIVGHSGDHHNIEFIKIDKPPQNNKERLDAIRVSFGAKGSARYDLPTKHPLLQ